MMAKELVDTWLEDAPPEIDRLAAVKPSLVSSLASLLCWESSVDFFSPVYFTSDVDYLSRLGTSSRLPRVFSPDVPVSLGVDLILFTSLRPSFSSRAF